MLSDEIDEIEATWKMYCTGGNAIPGGGGAYERDRYAKSIIPQLIATIRGNAVLERALRGAFVTTILAIQEKE